MPLEHEPLSGLTNQVNRRTDEQLAKLKEVRARQVERIVRQLVAGGGAKESARDST